MLNEQDGRLAIVDDAGGFFDILARYNGGIPNIDCFKQAFNKSTLRVSRVSRDHIIVPNATLTMCLAVQPHVMRALASKPALRESGLPGRFLYAWPDSKVGYRQTRVTPVPQAVLMQYHARVQALLRLTPDHDDAGQECPHMLCLSDEAAERFLAYREEVETYLRPTELLGEVREWGAKLCGQVARIAGLLHMAEHSMRAAPEAQQVGIETMESAIALGRYLTPHARALFAEMGLDPMVEQMRSVLPYIRTLTKEGKVKQSDLHNKLYHRFAKVADLAPVLEMLCERQYLRPNLPEGQRGVGRPSIQFDVNPLFTAESR